MTTPPGTPEPLSHETLSRLVDLAEDAIVAVDERQAIVLFNRGAAATFGYDPADALGRPLDLLLPARLAAAHREDVAAFARSAEASRAMGHRRRVAGRRRDGAEFPAEVTIAKVLDGGRLYLAAIVRDVSERVRMEGEADRLRRQVEHLSADPARHALVGGGSAMRAVARLIDKVAPTDATVLVRGPSGSGKEVVARAVHRHSRRADRPLVAVNCAALQEALLESELFGHERGAFTGADRAKRGLFEVADGGTLFVDEVAEMPPGMQAKLLRVLEDRSYRRVGGTDERRADVRVVAATNRPLEEDVRAGRFREDLFYRLNVFAIPLPPLAARREDIPPLVDHFLATRVVGGPGRCEVSPEALAALVGYDWPGNVRELANVLERAQILCDGRRITPADLPDALTARRPAPPAEAAAGAAARKTGVPTLHGVLDEERRLVESALAAARWNKVKAAKALGVSRRALYRLITRHGLGDQPGVGP